MPRLWPKLAGSPIDKKKIELETKDIKDAGVFNAKVRLYVGVVASFKIMVEVEQALIETPSAPPESRGRFWRFGKLAQYGGGHEPCPTNNDIIPMN